MSLRRVSGGVDASPPTLLASPPTSVRSPPERSASAPASYAEAREARRPPSGRGERRRALVMPSCGRRVTCQSRVTPRPQPEAIDRSSRWTIRSRDGVTLRGTCAFGHGQTNVRHFRDKLAMRMQARGGDPRPRLRSDPVARAHSSSSTASRHRDPQAAAVRIGQSDQKCPRRRRGLAPHRRAWRQAVVHLDLSFTRATFQRRRGGMEREIVFAEAWA